MKNKQKLRIAVLVLLNLALIASTALPRRVFAITKIPLANGNVWDVQDNTDDFNCPDDGSISDGNEDAFDGWGGLQVRVTDISDNITVSDESLCGFNLQWDMGRRWTTLNPVIVGTGGCNCDEERRVPGKPTEQRKFKLNPSTPQVASSGITASRAIYAPANTDYIRYIDTFTNTSGATRKVRVGWGGNLGSDSNTTVAGTSSGDLNIAQNDTWAVTIENSGFNPGGPATDPPVGYALRATNDTTFVGAGDTYDNPFTTAWAGNGSDGLTFVYAITLQPGESKSLAYFLYQGREEDGGDRPQRVAATAEVSKALSTIAALQANPDFSDLSPSARAAIVNWPLVTFDICLQDDSNRGNVLQINSQTGAYQFCCNGTTYTGTGTIKQRGQVLSLTHYPSNWKVTATVDNAQHHGVAAIQFPHATTPCTITDRNTLDDTCTCGAR